jgi:hypothetical protein
MLLLQHRVQLAFAAFAKKKPLKIHVIGDSHSSFCFTNMIPVGTHLERSLFRCKTHHNEHLSVFFSIHWLGPFTMFRIGRDGLKAFNLKSMKVQENEIAVFVFGEIDVRCHIEKQSAVQGKEPDAIIDQLVKQYIGAINENRNQFNHIHCVVCNVVPPSDNSFNPRYPFYGSLKTRIDITKKLNSKLQELCAANKISVLDLYTDHCTEQGDLSFEYCQGDVHIAPRHNARIKQKLLQLVL